MFEFIAINFGDQYGLSTCIYTTDSAVPTDNFRCIYAIVCEFVSL